MPRDDGDDAYAEIAREERRKKGERVIERFRKRAGKTKPALKKADTVTSPVLQRLKIERANLAKVRDDLRKVAEDAGELADNAERGLESLDEAIAILSEYV